MHIHYTFIISRNFFISLQFIVKKYSGQEQMLVIRFNLEFLTVCSPESSFQLMRHKMVEYVKKKGKKIKRERL
jgi:hypothetical protein